MNAPLTQIERLLTVAYNGYMNPFMDAITLTDSAQVSTYRHEIKHAKTFEILEAHPEFREEWERLAVDEKGKSLYLSDVEYVFSRFKGLNKIVSEEKLHPEENEKHGFVSNYARTNFYEDVAELATRTGSGTDFDGRFVGWLQTFLNTVIKSKVELAQKYGLVPKEFQEYVQLYAIRHKIFSGFSMDSEKAMEFLKESEAFFSRNPGSIYEADLRLARGNIFYCLPVFRRENANDRIRSGLEEYRRILQLPGRSHEYLSALFQLERMYKIVRDQEKAGVCGMAYSEYFKRLDSGDMTVIKAGVNEFLKSRGIAIGNN